MQLTNTILSAWVVIVAARHRRIRRLPADSRPVEAALVPSGFQNLVEAIYEAFLNISQQVGGERNGKKFFPFVFTIFIFLLIGNWFALFPWNNVIGPVENYREHYLHYIELDVAEVVCELQGEGSERKDVDGHEKVVCEGSADARPLTAANVDANQRHAFRACLLRSDPFQRLRMTGETFKLKSTTMQMRSSDEIREGIT